MQRLDQVLGSAGADTNNWTLTSANAITPDGRFVVGEGYYLGGETWAFIADLGVAPVIFSVSTRGPSIRIGWYSVPNMVYQLQSVSDLTQTNWTNVGNPITAFDPTTLATDLMGPDPARFYRVALLP